MRFPYSASVSFVVLTLLVAIGCGGGGGAGLTIPDSPDGTVRVVLDGLVEHQPEVVWRALPPSYQQDVLGLTRDFADTVDPAQLLDVEVDQLARMGSFVTADHLPGWAVDPREAVQPATNQNLVHGRGRHPGVHGQALRSPTFRLA